MPSIKKNVVYNMVYQLLNIALPLITAPYISRVLGADGVGVYSYTSSVNSYFVMAAAMGTSTYGLREIARVRDDKEKRSQSFWEIELMTVLTSAISLFIWAVVILVSENYKNCFIALTPLIFATMLDVTWFFAGVEQFQTIVLRNVVIKIIGIASLFLFVREKEELILYVFLQAFWPLIGNISMWIALPKYISKVRIRPSKVIIHLRNTFIYFVPTIATSVYTVLDKTLIGIITKSTFENGYYEQATKIVNLLKTVSFVSVHSVVGSRMAYLIKIKDELQTKKLLSDTLDITLFLSVGTSFGIAGIASPLVQWFYGSDYYPVILLLRILAPVVIIICISGTCGTLYYIPAGKIKMSTRFVFVGALINLILNLLLIPRFQSVGAIIATLIAESVITVLYVANSRSFIPIWLIISKIYKKLIAGFIMIGVLFILDGFTAGIMGLTGRVLFEIACGALVYILSLIALRDDGVKKTEKMLKNKLLKGV